MIYACILYSIQTSGPLSFDTGYRPWLIPTSCHQLIFRGFPFLGFHPLAVVVCLGQIQLNVSAQIN